MPRFHSLEARLQKNRTFLEIVSDSISNHAGSFAFFLLNLLLFIAWFIVNTDKVPGLPKFDPYPFNFLTMAVSLEAIFLSIFVLISQNRQSQIDSIRDEVHLQVDKIAEKEITKSLKLIADIHQKIVGKTEEDKELTRMLRAISTIEIEESLEKELSPAPVLISEFLSRHSKKPEPKNK